MVKRILPRTSSRLHHWLMIGLACWLALAGAFTHAQPVQAATLPVIYTGSSLPAVVGTAWSRTYSLEGGTAPYNCSISGTIPAGMSVANCTLSGTPTDFGAAALTISVTDSASTPNTGSTTLVFTAEAQTQTVMTLTSTHPVGASHYVAGYPVWVHAVVTYTPAIAGKVPVGTVTVTSGAGGPTCSIALDENGEGECALIFASEGTKTVLSSFQASGLGASYVRTSTDSEEIDVAVLDGPPALSAGRNHTCYLAANGQMHCWGSADGFSSEDDNDNPDPQDNYAKISAGSYHTCGLYVDGTIDCWGDETDVTLNVPNGQFVDISSGEGHVCAIDNVNRLHCWGRVDEGNTLLTSVPVAKVTAVSAGVGYACAIRKSNNQPICWGKDAPSPGSVLVKSLAVGNTHTCAIKSDGTLTCWGSPAMTPPAGNTYIAIESGSNYSCAQKSTGTLTCWGSGSPTVDTSTVFSRFSSGFLHTCALRPSGGTHTLSCWGNNERNQAPQIAISPTTLPQYLVEDRTFEQAFVANGGNEPYTFAVVPGGSLPAGLTLGGSTITGTMTTPGVYPFTLSAAETFSGSSLPLELTPGRQSYTTTVIDPVTSTSLTLTPNPVNAGSPVTASVTVTKNSLQPALTGDVLVSSTDGDATCRAEVVNGAASCTLYFSTAGDKTVIASYEGDEYFNPSNSIGRSVTVIPVVITPVVGAGNQFSCSIDADGQLDCWGKDDSYQSSQPPGSGVYYQLDLGGSHACALGLNRRVSCWGWDGYGIASPPTALDAVAKVTTGNEHSCALTLAGGITCWGHSLTNRLIVPSPGVGITYTNVDAGADHTCALKSDGSVTCWGSLTSAPAGAFTKLSAGGNFACALNASGSPTCWGGLTSAPAGPFTDLTAGGNFACGLKSDGSVACWGGRTETRTGPYSQITAGVDHACGLLSNGRMACWGSNTMGQAPVIAFSPASLPTIDVNAPWTAQISATEGDAELARTSEFSYSIHTGSLPAGLNINTTTGAISGTPTQAGVFNFTVQAQEASLTPAIVATKSYTLTVRGQVVAAVDSASPTGVMVGRPVQVEFSVHARPGESMDEEPTGSVTVSAEGNLCEVDLVDGEGSCTMLFATPGTKTITIEYPGDSLYQPGQSAAGFETNVIPFSQAPQLRTGLDHTYIYQANGTVGCIGTNCALDKFSGILTRLGVGDSYACGLQTNGSVVCQAYNGAPALDFSNGPYIDLSVGIAHVCALKIDGHAECLGDDTNGKATPPAGIFTSLSAGGGHTCALNASGEAICWGALSGSPIGNFTDLVSGDAHTCGHRANGTVGCWGDDSAGQITVPASPATFTRIAAGGAQTCGLDPDGLVTCWGDNTSGQTDPVFGQFIALATYDDHTCALREGQRLTCWGQDDAGEAPQYQFVPLPVTEIPALSFFEHTFYIDSGAKPLTAEVIDGVLPPGFEDPVIKDAPSSGNTIQDLSPAGMKLFGTPNTPGIYPFVIRWTDPSTYPVVMDQPYSLTVTGGDLTVELTPFSAADALEGMEYKFKAVVTNKTALAVPDVVLTFDLPDGLTDITSDHPDCGLSGSALICDLGVVDPTAAPSDEITVWVTGIVGLRSGEILQVSAGVESTDPVWPEINPTDNTDSFAVPVASRTILFSEDFEDSPAAETMPNGQRLLKITDDGPLELFINEIPAHKNVRISFDLYVVGGWLGNNPDGDPSRWRFGEPAEPPLLDTTFSNDPAFRQAYPGWFATGSYSARSGAAGFDELGTGGKGGADPDTRYRLTLRFAHGAEELVLTFNSLNLPAGAWWGFDNVLVEIDTGQTQIFLPLVTTTK